MTAHAPQTNQQTPYPSEIIDSDELGEEYSIKRINASIFGAYLRTVQRLVVSLYIYIYRFSQCFIHLFNYSNYLSPPRRLSENRSLLRKSGFWPIFPIKFVKYSKYSPHLIKKMDSKPLSLATASILRQPPGIPERQSEINHLIV